MLIDHGADPFQPFSDETTIMHELLDQGATVEPLLTLPGLGLETRDGRGRTLLLAACDAQNAGGGRIRRNYVSREARECLIRRLYEMGADVIAVDNDGNSVLHMLVNAIGTHDEKDKITNLLLWFIEKCPALLHQRNGKGYKPFHLAVEMHDRHTSEVLIDAGADVLEPDPNGNTVLHHLASLLGSNDSKSQRNKLGEAQGVGLDINARNNDGDTPLSRYILSLGGNFMSSLREPAHQKTVQRFQDAGADFFTRNNAGETLLHLVARLRTLDLPLYGNRDTDQESFTFLMGMGLDPFLEDNQQRTSLVGSTLFFWLMY